jgi:hypothetical protein
MVARNVIRNSGRRFMGSQIMLSIGFCEQMYTIDKSQITRSYQINILVHSLIIISWLL